MGYQALLFCADEKAARSVTQVLSELDFEVTLCTEPFAAVKKMMGVAFDAVVVDCENEQNATLLFKSARNAPNCQSALAVAVVEGQAGVAKAFRIGANLILTKPVNLEQAKGTLRVARGLLRKNEIPKNAAVAVNPAPFGRALSEPITAGATPDVPAAIPAPPIQRAAAPSVTAMTVVESAPVPAPAQSAYPANPGAAIGSTVSKGHSARPGAAAAAPAREPQADFTRGSAVKSISEAQPEGTANAADSPSGRKLQERKKNEPENQEEKEVAKESKYAKPAFSFEMNQAKSPAGKKTLLAIAAIVLLAAAAYFAWVQFGVGQRLGLAAPSAVAASATPKQNPVSLPASIANHPAVDSGTLMSTAPAQPAPLNPGSGTQAAGVADATGSGRTRPTNGDTEASAVKAPALPASEAEESPAARHAIVMHNNPASMLPPDIVAPGIAAMPTTGGQGLQKVLSSASDAPTPRLQTVNISQGISQGLLLKQAQPAYPPDALRLGVEGPVQLLATISKTGEISSIKTLSGDNRLAHAAVAAVKQWKYKPYLLNGEPVEVETQITVNFKLPR